MADIKVSQLPQATSGVPTDIMMIVQGGVSKQVLVGKMNPFRGALVYDNAELNAALDASPGGDGPYVWSAESYDTDGFHSLVTDKHRLTVPAGVTKVRVSAATTAASLQLDSGVYIRKNGTQYYPGSPRCVITNTDTVHPGFGRVTLCSAVITVAEGDYFELFQESCYVPVDDTGIQWLAIEVIE